MSQFLKAYFPQVAVLVAIFVLLGALNLLTGAGLLEARQEFDRATSTSFSRRVVLTTT